MSDVAIPGTDDKAATRPRAAASTPSPGRQMSYIIENAGILNLETKKAILALVMMEIGASVVSEIGKPVEVNIDLDAIASVNEDVLLNVYNMVRARREALNFAVYARS